MPTMDMNMSMIKANEIWSTGEDTEINAVEDMFALIEKAHDFLIIKLDGVLRFDGTSVAQHCFRVSKNVELQCKTATFAMVIAALLHDVVEDTTTTLEERGQALDEIEEKWGPDVRRLVDAVSRKPDEAYLAEFIPRIAQDQQAIEIKRFDILDNLSTLPLGHKLVGRYTSALNILLREELGTKML